ncbi:MAG: wax ester/triacylglycerol synthase family O-acyltransferase [Proteobacteria bacterium]|jgi:WS/DGAT/MGAT family acyltransferase|nr:wax ester/triacylglycerol synthase family O-acyltransferase [Pseudomonadota bacterium]
MYQLSALDNVMLEGDAPGLPLHMSAAMIYDTGNSKKGAIGFEALSSTLERIIDEHFPILRCRAEALPLMLDKAYWANDEAFDLSAQASRVALPAPADWAEFYRLFGQFHATRLDRDKPLWQMIQVEGLDALDGLPAGSTALFFKVHHAMMDGIGAMRLLRGFHSTSPRGKPTILKQPAADVEAPNYQSPGPVEKYGRALRHGLARPVNRTGTLLKMLPDMLTPKKRGNETPKVRVPSAHFDQQVKGSRVIGHVRMDMATLCQLEETYDCTINDLALCVVAEAQRQFLLGHGELPDESLVAAMPINIRQRNDKGEVGNRLTLARVPLFTDTDDMKARLRAVISETTRDKSEGRKSGGGNAMQLIEEIHPAFITWLLKRLYYSGFFDSRPPVVNTIVSNVPGFPDETYLMGARLIDYLGFGPLGPGIGLFHTVSSTPDHVNISFVSTADMVGDGAGYCAALRSGYEELLSSL